MIYQHADGGLYRRVNPDDRCTRPYLVGEGVASAALVLYLPLSGRMPDDLAEFDCFATHEDRWDNRFIPLEPGNFGPDGYHWIRYQADGRSSDWCVAHFKRGGDHILVAVLDGAHYFTNYLRPARDGQLLVGSASITAIRPMEVPGE